MWKTVVCLVAIALTGCANMSNGQLDAGAKYYQALSPLTEEPMVQVELISNRACKNMMELTAPKSKQLVRCSGQDASDSLPWRAVIHNPALAATFAMDASTKEACQSLVASIEKTAADSQSGARVVMPCTLKLGRHAITF